MKARLMILLALLVGLAALTGCSSDNNEHHRLVAEADLVNAGTPLVVAALNDNGTGDDPADDFVPIETLNVVFSARPLNNTMEIEEFGPYSTFNITAYDLTWIPSVGAPAGLTAYNVRGGRLTVSVPVYDEIEASVLVGNLSMKAEAWFPGNPFTADLVVTFYGHSSGSEDVVSLEVGTTVQFLQTVADN